MIVFHLIAILSIHFIADFLFQSRKMAENKSTSIMWLSIHVFEYLITLLSVSLLFGHFITDNIGLLIQYCFLNAALHWVTDFVTSKASSRCYFYLSYYEKNPQVVGSEEEKNKWTKRFWSIIGFDQFLHAFALLITYHYFFV